MERAALTSKDLSALRARANKMKSGELGVEIVKLANKRARELTKEAGVTDPVALSKVVAVDVRKDEDGNWLFSY